MNLIVQTSIDVSKFLSDARKKARMSFEEVGAKAGFSPQTVSNIEKNKGGANMNSIIAIAQVLGVSIILSNKTKEQ